MQMSWSVVLTDLTESQQAQVMEFVRGLGIQHDVRPAAGRPLTVLPGGSPDSRPGVATRRLG